jgi:hypothetical protein
MGTRQKTFIKGMKDKIGLGNEAKVLHKGDEGQNPAWKPGEKSLIKIIKDSTNFYDHLI